MNLTSKPTTVWMSVPHPQNEKAEPLTRSDAGVCHAGCGAAAAPSLARIIATFGRCASMELEATFNRAIRIWWSLTWRSILISVPCTLGFYFVLIFLAASFGSALGILEAYSAPIRVICWGISFIFSLTVSVLMILWILDLDYGEFRIALLSSSSTEKHAGDQSLTAPNHSPDPTPAPGMPPAGQEPRHG
jgi:hypothetical protein